jgi:two-component system response regulator
MHELAHILLIEDNEDDYEAMRRSFVKSGFVNPLTWCRNAEGALRMLRRDESHADKAPPRPDLILLDLNMPGMDGRRFLELIKADEHHRSIPVVVLTTSADAVDINRCYQSGASTYIQKPITFEGLIKAVRALKDYWFVAKLPPHADYRRRP